MLPQDLEHSDKIRIVLYLADCGRRDGLTARQGKELGAAREALASAYVNRENPDAALTSLRAFYAQLPVIKNCERAFTVDEAVANDRENIKYGVRTLDPELLTRPVPSRAPTRLSM